MIYTLSLLDTVGYGHSITKSLIFRIVLLFGDVHRWLQIGFGMHSGPDSDRHKTATGTANVLIIKHVKRPVGLIARCAFVATRAPRRG